MRSAAAPHHHEGARRGLEERLQSVQDLHVKGGVEKAVVLEPRLKRIAVVFLGDFVCSNLIEQQSCGSFLRINIKNST